MTVYRLAVRNLILKPLTGRNGPGNRTEQIPHWIACAIQCGGTLRLTMWESLYRSSLGWPSGQYMELASAFDFLGFEITNEQIAKWTKGDLLKHMGIADNSPLLQANQIQGGLMIIKKH